jgi:hypothetical protein
MSLTVGELNAILSVDDRAVDPALRRAEQALRQSGQRMGGDADRAGRQAGEALGEGLARSADGAGEDAGREAGEGFVRGADGQWRNMRAELVDAVTAASLEAEAAAHRGGQRAGEALGDGLTEGADQGADDAVTAAEGGLSRMQTMAAGVGLAAGAVLMSSMASALEQGQITGKLRAQLGATPAEAARYGKVAGQLFAKGITVDFQTAADAIRATMSNNLVPAGATNAQLESIATKVSDLASTFDLDLGQTATAVGQLIRTKMAPDAKTALDLIAAGMKGTDSRADDLLETMTEYGTIFQQVGINGATAMGLIKQGLKSGVKDTDKIADSFKELQLKATEGSKPTADALKALGLDAKKTGDDIAAGGDRGAKGLDSVLDALRKMGPGSQEAKQIVSTLFGGPGEDLGASLFALDVDKAAKSMDGAAGSAAGLGRGLRDNAGAQLTEFQGKLRQGLVDTLNAHVLPALAKLAGWAMKNTGTLKLGAAVITGVLVPAFVLMGVTATVRSAQVVAGWVMSGAASLSSAGTQVAAGARVVASWVLMGLRATGQALRVVAGWVSSAAAAGVNALRQVAAGARVVAAWVLMGVQSMIQAGRMAAAWFIALGPVGWIIATLIGLGLLIWANWDKVKKWTGQAWNWIWGKIKAVGVGIVRSVASFIAGALAKWDQFKVGSIAKVAALVSWMRGLPGRLSASFGDLGSLLVSKGRAVVQGLWSGIQGMGGWIRSKLMSWAKAMIPKPIAKALGIKSPSKVTTQQGRWIARGLIAGLTGSSKQVRAASLKLSDIVADGLAPGAKRSKALGKLSSGTKQLLAMARQEEALAARTEAATKRLDDLRKARAKLAEDVAKGVLESADITKQDADGWPQTAETILAGLKQDTMAAQAFAKNLAQLRKRGIRSDLVAQIAQAGVAQGSSAAAALANATSGQVKQINSQQAALVTAANRAGATAGDAMYGSGIRAAQGLVKGLQSQQKAIDRQMAKIAKSMSASIRRALGIRSPSRVMALVGRYTAQGLIAGVDSQRSAVDASMAGLVNVPAPGSGSWDMASAGARRGAANKTVIEIRADRNQEGRYLLGQLQRGIRKNAGPDIQYAFTGKRSG